MIATIARLTYRCLSVSTARGNRLAGAQAPYSAFARGEGMTMAGIEAVLGTGSP